MKYKIPNHVGYCKVIKNENNILCMCSVFVQLLTPFWCSEILVNSFPNDKILYWSAEPHSSVSSLADLRTGGC